MKQLSQQQLQNQIDNFNEIYKVGDKVEVYRTKGGETFIDEIKHEATILGGHTAMTWLKDKGCYDLTFVKGPVKTLMHCLTSDGITAVYNDVDELTTSIKNEIENYDDESLLNSEYTISFRLMSEKEIKASPEFDGF